jgi:hypothetical protein
MDKEYVKLQIAEEAMLHGIVVWWKTPTKSRLLVEGDRFLVSANLIEMQGWIVKVANICSGNDGVGNLEHVMDDYYFEDKDDDDDDVEEEEAEEDNKKKKKEKEPTLRTPLQSH